MILLVSSCSLLSILKLWILRLLVGSILIKILLEISWRVFRSGGQLVIRRMLFRFWMIIVRNVWKLLTWIVLIRKNIIKKENRPKC